ncbi:hypothetical protein DPEC_G00137810 [Dallia pectoralis]|uniref:Uncharacterized protein n=1 Tax=Dallia pectoralis TaxID=75939 RepID=A0ACC2GLR4_DALPE|nr:hypothetical protein DPEC_G00137810 [Dallia pectoralis]
MTPLIWIFIWLLPRSALCDLPAAVNVSLSSNHFIHLLTWAPGPGTPSGVHYRVMVNKLRQEVNTWKDAAGCEHVQSPLVCNLTEEFSDKYETHYYRVHTVLGDEPSSMSAIVGFDPFSTHLDPPLVTVGVCNSTLCVDLKPPLDSLRDVYDTFEYNLTINRSQYNVPFNSPKRVVLKDLAPGQKYCVSAIRFRKVGRSWKNFFYSRLDCASTPVNHTAGTGTGILVVAFMAVIIIPCAVYLLIQTGYLCLKQDLPHVLLFIKHQDMQLLESGSKENFSVVQEVLSSPPSVRKHTESDDDDDDDSKVERTSCGGYKARRRDYAPLTSHNLLSSTSTCPLSPLVAANDQRVTPDCPLSGLSPTARVPDEARGVSPDFSKCRLSPEAVSEDPQLTAEDEERSCQEISLLSVSLGGRERMRPMARVVVGPDPQGTSGRDDSPERTSPILPSVTEFWAPRTHPATEEEEEEEEEEDEEEESQGYLCRSKT